METDSDVKRYGRVAIDYALAGVWCDSGFWQEASAQRGGHGSSLPLRSQPRAALSVCLASW